MSKVRTARGRMDAIDTWLAEHDAQLLHSHLFAQGQIEVYALGRATTLLLHVYADGGWEVYAPVTTSNSIAGILAALEERFGPPQGRGET